MASFFDNKARAAAAAASSSKSKEPVVAAPALQPWVEKYRPKTLEEVRGQDHATNTLRRMLNASNFPHFLFYGPPGTGKTSTILALAKELYGPELVRSRILELNASDERGLTVVRSKIRDFARQQLSNAPLSKEYRARYPCPSFKIIILDEADSLTQDAQSALRRVVEIYSKVTRFCLCCNYVTRIIDPLASRCSKYRFKPLDSEEAADRLREIVKAEQVALEDGVIEKLLATSDGDLRRAITYLQSCARSIGSTTTTNGHTSKRGRKPKVFDDEDEEMLDADAKGNANGSRISVRMVEEITGVIPSATMAALISAIQPRKTGVQYNDIARVVTDIVADGWSATSVLQQLYSEIMFDDTVDSRKKQKMMEVFSECDKRLVDGSDEHLLTLDVLLRLSGVLARR